MNLSPIYQQWREKILQEGRQEVFDQQREFVENLLSTRVEIRFLKKLDF